MNFLSTILHLGGVYGRASVQASVLILLVLLVQRVLRRWLSPGWQHALWLLVLVRLTVVYAPPSIMSWESLAERGLRTATAISEDRALEAGGVPTESGVPSVPRLAPPSIAAPAPVAVPVGAVVSRTTADVEGTAGAKGPGWERWREMLAGVWLAGVGLLLLRMAMANVLFQSRVRQAAKLPGERVPRIVAQCRNALGLREDVPVLESGWVTGPCLFGLRSPQILFPKGMIAGLSDEELRHVLLHELAHVKRRDLVVHAWFGLATAFHWFNPLVWFASERCRRDREIACDATVLGVLGAGDAPSYGRTILGLVTGTGTGTPSRSRSIAVAGILENRIELRRRIAMIGEFGVRRTSGLLAAAVALVLALLGWTGRANDRTGTGFRTLDLTRNADYPTGAWEVSGGYTAQDVAGTWHQVPRGRQVVFGVPFSVEAMIRLAGEMVARNGWRFRETTGEIPVGRAFDRLYLLHATYYGGREDEVVSRIWLRYVDGRREKIEVLFGRHVRNWHRQKHDYPVNLRDPESRLVWTGQEADAAIHGKSLRLFATSLHNPRPDTEVESLEIVSGAGLPTHVILGITVGDGDLPEQWRGQPKLEEVEHPPTGKLVFQAVDGSTGQPLAGFQLDFEAAQERSHFILGRFFTDASGRAELPYPEGDLRYFDIWVSRSGYVPKIVHWETQRRGPFPAEYRYRAEPGIPIGGRVLGPLGAPLANIPVRITGPGLSIADDRTENLALTLAQSRTDAAGNWEYRGVPVALAKSDGVLATIALPGYETWQGSGETLAESPVASLVPLPKLPEVRGMVVDRSGRGVPALVRLDSIAGEADLGLRLVSTDAGGRFRFGEVPRASQYRLSVVAEGYAPQHRQVEGMAAAGEFLVTLESGTVVEGEVRDDVGRPLGGVEVAIRDWGGALPIRRTAVTDARGVFVWGNAPTFPVVFDVSHRDYLPGALVSDSGSSVGRLSVRLVPRLRLDFDVTEAGGSKPIRHGRVLSNSGEADEALVVAGVVNEGRCSLIVPGTGQGTDYRVEAEGYEAASVKVVRRPGEAVVRVDLRRPAAEGL